MTDPATLPALATALAYHQAWTSHNLDQAMTYIADGITCDAPGAQISGAGQYRAFLGGFMAQLTGVQTVAAFGDDTSAVLVYYPHTATVSDAPTADCLTVAGGKSGRGDRATHQGTVPPCCELVLGGDRRRPRDG